ncbi:MAG TPA: ATP-binding protein [Burkholderiaceae bacterium]|nr:ATP-binding protein [Burkholderiaceae bacterium]
MMRVTIAKKLAFAVIAMVVLSVGAMAWITSSNLERGFIAYLNELQAEHLENVRVILSEQYRTHGNFDWLRGNPRLLNELVASRSGDIHPELDQPPPPREDGPPPRRNGDSDDRPPPRDDDRPPPPDGARPPPRIPYAAGSSGTQQQQQPPPRNTARPPPADPFGFGPRLSFQDADGRHIIGPPNPGPGLVRTVEVDGRVVGTLTLIPLRQIPATSASGFVRGQIRDILWLAAVLILLSNLLAIWLARRLLRPVASLRIVTEQIAQGKLDARAPILGRDELATLAEHVNAMAQALETNEQQRRKMLADVSHELRTPLTVIRGEIEALLDGIRQADSNALESLHVEVLRLNKLVDDLHQLALADAGDLHYACQHINLIQLVNDVAERFKARAEKAGLHLLTKLPTQELTIDADTGRLTQVVTNLLENSVRYTDAGGSIVLSLRKDGKHAELCLEDSAPGVPEGAHVRLFERLYRADQARSRGRGGSGLGLSICKSLVEAHQGRIWAMPSSLGGLKLLIRLPLSRSEEN